MEFYRCRFCGYIYKKDIGDPKGGVAPGTDFADLPAAWVCPVCGASHDQFDKIGEPAAGPISALGILMIEHRLIERIIPALLKERLKIEQGAGADTQFIREAADFLHTYADLVHHGKEENVLFLRLKTKSISPTERSLMDELFDEHRQARENVQALLASAAAYDGGDKNQTGEIMKRLDFLIELYPRHIKNEDEIFFPDALNYFSAPEMAEMSVEMKEVDQRIPSGKYYPAMKLWEKR
jgi:hemerythrin-like domain-containing protein/rubredoxin